MKTKIFFTILLLYVVTSVSCAPVEDDIGLDSPYNQADFKLTRISSLILLQIDLVACLYIFVRTFLQWKQCDKNSMPMSLRSPFYIALTEFCISILQTINWSSLDNPLCSIIGLFTTLLLAFLANLVTFITFTIWYKVTRNVEFNSGRYDYIMFLISIGFAIFTALLGIARYNEDEFWCAAQTNKKAFFYIILIITIVHMTLLSIFYIKTHMYMRRSQTNKLSFNGRDLQDDHSNARMSAKKTISYSLAFGCQLLLIMIFIIISIATTENTTIVLFRMLGISIGGLLIALQYILNEDWVHGPQKCQPQNNPDEIASSSFRNSLQHIAGIRLPFTKIQVEVVQQQTTTQQL